MHHDTGFSPNRKGLRSIELEAKKKANSGAVDPGMRVLFALVAGALETHRLHHPDRCPCGAKAMPEAA